MIAIAATMLIAVSTLGVGPTNTRCPISDQPVNASSPTVNIDGTAVAVCCKRCKAKAEAMDGTAQAALLAKVQPADDVEDEPSGQSEQERPKQPAEAQSLVLARAYILPNCPLSRKGIESMNQPATKRIGDRDVSVCCPGCFRRIEENPDRYNKRIDDWIIERQKGVYPLKTCIVTGRPLGEDTVDLVFGNRLVRLCCGQCAITFKADPAKHLKALDAALIKATPFKGDDTCIVSGRPLRKAPVELVIGNRVIRTCCGDCRLKVLKNPRIWVERHDAAARKGAAQAS
ncbi:MAG: hypothetical protein MK101_08935 [Phycisphaerales bacterium]|nr:hypothetical protein [Phycisphaerales bacterium]